MGEAQLAAPQPLVRCLGVAGVLFLTLSVTTPASSVFVIVPGMLQTAGTGAIWATLIAALICVTTAFIYAELSSAWPVAGGEYVMVAHTLGPLAGFVMLGVNIFSNLLFPPVAALGVAAVLGTVIPGLPAVQVAIAVLAASTLVALLNIRVNAMVTGLFLLVELLALLVVIWLGFAHQLHPVADMILRPVMPDAAAMVPASVASVGVATSIAIFAFNGYGVAVYFGEEMHEAPRLIARTVLWAVALAILFVGVPIVATLAGAPDLHRLVTADDPFGLLVGALAPGWVRDAVSIGIVIAIVNAIIAAILSCARFFYSSARDRCWGRRFDGLLSAIHPRFGSPWIGTLLIGAFMIAACFMPLTFLLVVNGAGLIVIYAGMAAAVIVGRRGGHSAHAPYRMPLYPIAPIVTLAALAYVVWTSWLDVEEGRPGLIVTAGQVLLSAAYYRFVLRRRGEWEVQIPALPGKG
jgi:amino acid transporter